MRKDAYLPRYPIDTSFKSNLMLFKDICKAWLVVCQFLKYFVGNFTCKSSPNIWLLLGLFLKHKF